MYKKRKLRFFNRHERQERSHDHRETKPVHPHSATNDMMRQIKKRQGLDVLRCYFLCCPAFSRATFTKQQDIIAILMQQDVGVHYEVMLGLLNMTKLYHQQPRAFLPVRMQLYRYGIHEISAMTLDGKTTRMVRHNSAHTKWLDIYDEYKVGLTPADGFLEVSRTLLQRFQAHFRLPTFTYEIEDAMVSIEIENAMISVLLRHASFWEGFFLKDTLELPSWRSHPIQYAGRIKPYDDGGE